MLLVSLSRLCSACQLGKSYYFALSGVDKLIAHVFDFIYTYIWGPTPVLSSTAYRYFIVFVDDYSRCTWYFPMHLKYDLYAIFYQFRALVERQFSCQIKSIQSDLGGEYCKLHAFLTSFGIDHRQSCAYTHE